MPNSSSICFKIPPIGGAKEFFYNNGDINLSAYSAIEPRRFDVANHGVQGIPENGSLWLAGTDIRDTMSQKVDYLILNIIINLNILITFMNSVTFFTDYVLTSIEALKGIFSGLFVVISYR